MRSHAKLSSIGSRTRVAEVTTVTCHRSTKQYRRGTLVSYDRAARTAFTSVNGTPSPFVRGIKESIGARTSSSWGFKNRGLETEALVYVTSTISHFVQN